MCEPNSDTPQPHIVDVVVLFIAGNVHSIHIYANPSPRNKIDPDHFDRVHVPISIMRCIVSIAEKNITNSLCILNRHMKIVLKVSASLIFLTNNFIKQEIDAV